MLALVAYIIIAGYNAYMQNQRLAVDPNSYFALLQLIAKAESNDNYNAYYANPNNNEIRFTEMTIEEVLEWQSDFIQQGSPSSAVGKYQLLNTTLMQLVDELKLNKSLKFSPSIQDKLAIALIERRGSEKYINNEISREEFAANLAKEWAALPSVIGNSPSSSFYAGDDLNRARVSVDEALNTIDQIRPEK